MQNDLWSSTISVRRAAFNACLFTLRPQQMQMAYAPDELRLFWLWEKPEHPQFEPYARIKMAQVLGSPLYICEWSTTLQSLESTWF